MDKISLQLNKIKSGHSRPSNIAPTNTKKVGVLGSGMMGHGITYITSISGLEVIMTDTTQENAERGLERIKSILTDEVNKGKMAGQEMQEALKTLQDAIPFFDIHLLLKEVVSPLHQYYL